MAGNDGVQTLVNRIISYEAVGDAPLVSFPDTGTLQGRDARVAAINEVHHAMLGQAVSDMDRIRGIEDDVGAVVVALSTMSEHGRRPLTGREVAGVLTSALFSTEAFQAAVASGAVKGDTLSPEGTRQILEQFRAYLMEHSEENIKESELPPGIDRIPEAALREFVESSTVVLAAPATTASGTPATPPAPAVPAVPVHDEQEVRTAANGEQYTLDRNGRMIGLQEASMEDVRAALRERSDRYGGAPHYADGVPRLPSDARVTLWGSSYETMYTFCRAKADDPDTWFSGFWDRLAHFYEPQNVTNMEGGGVLTAYEDNYNFLESVDRLQTHQEVIQTAYSRGQREGDAMLTSLTRLTPHTSENGGPAVIAQALREYTTTFLHSFAEARAENRLDAFFDHALGGACFPARSRFLNDFADTGALRRLDAAQVELQERMNRAAAEELLQLEGAVARKEQEWGEAQETAQGLTTTANAPGASPEAKAAAAEAQATADGLKADTDKLRATLVERQNAHAADAAVAAALEAARQRQLDRMTPVFDIIEAAHRTWPSLDMALNGPDKVSWQELRRHILAEGRSEREFGNFDFDLNNFKPRAGFLKMTEEWLDANAYSYFKDTLYYDFFDGPDATETPA